MSAWSTAIKCTGLKYVRLILIIWLPLVMIYGGLAMSRYWLLSALLRMFLANIFSTNWRIKMMMAAGIRRVKGTVWDWKIQLVAINKCKYILLLSWYVVIYYHWTHRPVNPDINTITTIANNNIKDSQLIRSCRNWTCFTEQPN